MKWNVQNGFIEPDRFCSFGITEIGAAALATALGEIGIGTGVAGAAGGAVGIGSEIAAGAALGAGLGAGGSALLGGDPGQGALFGGLTGGAASGLGIAFGGAGGAAPAASETAATTAASVAGPSAASVATPAVTAFDAAPSALETSTGAVALPSSADLASGAAASNIATGASGAAANNIATGANVTPFDPFDTTRAGLDLTRTGTTSPIAAAADNAVTDVGGDFGGGSDRTFGSNVFDFAKKNPGLLLSGGLLGAQYLMGQQPYPAENQLRGLAANAQNEAAALAAPSRTGVLPPGEEAAVTLAKNAAEASARSTYGGLGLSGSTMESQAIGGAEMQAAALKAAIANNLLGTAAKFSGIASADAEVLLNAQIKRDSAFNDALARFIGGLAGSGFKPVTTD